MAAKRSDGPLRIAWSTCQQPKAEGENEVSAGKVANTAWNTHNPMNDLFTFGVAEVGCE